MKKELECEYENRSTFWGAEITEENGVKTLTSYNTEVCEIKNGQVKIFGFYSSTTLRHIKEFLKQNGFKAETKDQMFNDYTKEGKEGNKK